MYSRWHLLDTGATARGAFDPGFCGRRPPSSPRAPWLTLRGCQKLMMAVASKMEAQVDKQMYEQEDELDDIAVGPPTLSATNLFCRPHPGPGCPPG